MRFIREPEVLYSTMESDTQDAQYIGLEGEYEWTTSDRSCAEVTACEGRWYFMPASRWFGMRQAPLVRKALRLEGLSVVQLGAGLYGVKHLGTGKMLRCGWNPEKTIV